MSTRSEQAAAERRKHPRFPVVEGLVEPITVNFDEEKPAPGEHRPAAGPKNQPALLVNLSAGGMSLILFMEPPRSKKFEMLLNLPGLERVPIEGRVVRVLEKGATFNVGIAFTKISRKHEDQINGMAQDHLDCETRIGLNLPEACVPNCRFRALCAKPQKVRH